MPACSR